MKHRGKVDHSWQWLRSELCAFQSRDQARRFITLVDELYNARTRLVCTAEALPEQLFAGAADDAPVVDLESLQFEGAVEGGRRMHRKNLPS